MESKKYSMDLAGRELTLEFGKYCEQAAGSVWVHLGDTVVMVNATMAPDPPSRRGLLPAGCGRGGKAVLCGQDSRRLHQA